MVERGKQDQVMRKKNHGWKKARSFVQTVRNHENQKYEYRNRKSWIASWRQSFDFRDANWSWRFGGMGWWNRGIRRSGFRVCLLRSCIKRKGTWKKGNRWVARIFHEVMKNEVDPLRSFWSNKLLKYGNWTSKEFEWWKPWKHTRE